MNDEAGFDAHAGAGGDGANWDSTPVYEVRAACTIALISERPKTIDAPTQPERPEQAARRTIDDAMRAAGWRVQSADAMELSAGLGVAVAELPMGAARQGASAVGARGFADYVLHLDREPVGVVEAKPHGMLSGAEQQTMHYAFSEARDFSGVGDRPERRARFLFQSNGHKTYFTDLEDPSPRAREVFNFPRPETLAEWNRRRDGTLRRRLRRRLPLDESRLWAAQARAIHALEASLRRGDQRALI